MNDREATPRHRFLHRRPDPIRDLLRWIGILPALLLWIVCVPPAPAVETADPGATVSKRAEYAVRAARLLLAAVEEDAAARARIRDAIYRGEAPPDATPPSNVEAVAVVLGELLAPGEIDTERIARFLERKERELPPPGRGAASGKERTPGRFELIVEPGGRWALPLSDLARVFAALNASAIAAGEAEETVPLDRVLVFDLPTVSTGDDAGAPSWLDPVDAAKIREWVERRVGGNLDGCRAVVIRDSRPPFGDDLPRVPEWEPAMRRMARASCRGDIPLFGRRYGMSIADWNDLQPADVLRTGEPGALRADLLEWTRRLHGEFRSALIDAVRGLLPEGTPVLAAWDAERVWAGAPRAVWEDPYTTFSAVRADGWLIHYGNRIPQLLDATFWSLGYVGRPWTLWEETRTRDIGPHPLAYAYRHGGAWLHVRARPDLLTRLARQGRRRRFLQSADPALLKALPRIPDFAIVLCQSGMEQSPAPGRPWDLASEALRDVRPLGVRGALVPDKVLRDRNAAIYPFRCVWLAGARSADRRVESTLAQWLTTGGGTLIADGPVGALRHPEVPGKGPRTGILAALGIAPEGDRWILTAKSGIEVEVIDSDESGEPLSVEAVLDNGTALIPLGSPADPLPEGFLTRAVELCRSRLAPMPARLIPAPGEPTPLMVANPTGRERWFLQFGNLGARPAPLRWSSPRSWASCREYRGTAGKGPAVDPADPPVVTLAPGETIIYELTEAGDR